ncbi:pantetheine-phosphate adenylyltransferase [bacterium]|nr:MAG: pantetheine-phosphate adenylyltransferase [bacterium]
MARLAVYPGSFDPPTLGHLDIVERAARLFDGLVVAVGRNSTKRPLLDVEARCEALRRATSHLANVSVDAFDGLLVNYVQGVGASAIVRGLRATQDFEYEYQMTLVNRRLRHEVETVFLMTSPDFGYLSSSIVREVAVLGGDYEGMVPEGVAEVLRDRLAQKP